MLQGLDEHILPRRKKFKNGMAMYETVVRNDSGLHVLLWMVLQLTPFQFGRDIFRRFLASDRKGIHNPDFLLYFVILPVNEIVKGMKKDFDNRKLFGGRRPNVPAAKMKLFFNAWYTALYLKILVEKGLDITFPKPQENERCILDQFIQSTTFGTVEPVNVDTGLPDDYSKRIAVPLQAAMICYADALCKNRAEKRPWFSTLEGRWISEDGVITEENQLDSLLKQSATPFIWYTKWIEKVLQGDIKPDHQAFSVAGSPRKKKSPEQSRGKRKQEEDNPKPIRKKKKTAEGAFGAFHGFFSKELDSLLGDLNKDWASNRETKKRVDNFLASLNEKGRKVSVSVWKNLVVTDGAITTENKSDEGSEGGMIV